MLATFRADTTNPLAMAADKLRAGVRMRDALHEPTFASPEQEAFFASAAPELLYSGWMGAGKSRILCEKAWWLGLQHPGAELGLFRKVKASMPATTERTFWEEVVDFRYVVARNRSENWVDVAALGRRPSRIWFLGLDADPRTGTPTKVGSLNLDWAGVDEAIELTEADWIMLRGRLRRNAIGYRQLAAATNPAAPTHWLKTLFTPPTAAREFLVASGNRFLPPDYQASLADLGDSVHARRLGKGEWVAAEGSIWVLPVAQIADPPAEQTTWKRVVGGLDWGYTHAAAAEVIGESGSGRRAVLDEVFATGLLVGGRDQPGTLIPRLIELTARHHVDTWYADPSEPAYIRQCREAGLNVVEAANDVIPGITAVESSLRAGMTVSPRCTGLIRQIAEYVWKLSRDGKPVKEEPVKVNDDAPDALRYAVMGLDTGTPGLLSHYRARAEQVAARKATTEGAPA